MYISLSIRDRVKIKFDLDISYWLSEIFVISRIQGKSTQEL